MSHEEPRRELLPSRRPDYAPPAAALTARAERFAEADRSGPPLTAPRPSSTAWVGRTWRRHWWQIAPLWLLGAAVVGWYLPRWFPNSFEATSDVQIEAGQGGPGNDPNAGASFETFKQTQARRIVGPNIIAAAINQHPGLGDQLARAEATDPETAIQRGIGATLQPNTHLIQVTMTAARNDGLAEIVDAVIHAYLAVATDFNEEGVLQRSIKFRTLLRAKEQQVAEKRAAVAAMVARMGTLDADQGRERHAAAIRDHAALSDQLLKTDLDIVEEQARLDRMKQDEATYAATPRPESRVKAEAVASFYKLSQVIAITDQLDQGKQNLLRADREPGRTTEAARKALQQKNDDLQRQIDNLWSRLSPELMLAAQNAPLERAVPESSKTEGHLNGLKARQAMLNERLKKVKDETLAGGSEVLTLEFARQDLIRAETVLESMTQTTNQAEVASNQPIARFRQEHRAKTTEKSALVPRLLVGIGAPLGLFLGLIGFFGLIEKQAGRILDPSDLPARARLNVIGLVPPLPRNRGRLGLSSAGTQRAQVDVERFIQSLDQLRVLVCGRSDRDGRPRRSLLITSASENEGKSTLAAQLAERSVNAGLLTLLIDADLRNPTLSRMFDRPDSVGLANVLRGELLAEEAIGTVPEAGGFHFLPAGLVRDDLARLLQSERLARLLESARESFDLVLVDSPPVLPVADALTIGQWVDGAILTVRHRVSRLPLVERASQQLSSVGVSILGAVVSGVKDRYAPYYGSKPSSDPTRDATDGSAV